MNSSESYLSSREISEDENEYTRETENVEKRPDTISMTDKLEECFQEKYQLSFNLTNVKFLLLAEKVTYENFYFEFC